MLVTEDEAKTKRCQEGFAAADGISADGIPVMQPTSVGVAYPHGAAGYYGVSHGGAPMNCIGSACMAWRWRLSGHQIDRSQNDDRSRGYCGKAGVSHS